LTGPVIASLVTSFHRVHERSYGYGREKEGVEFVNIRVICVGRLPRAEAQPGAPGRVSSAEPQEYRGIVFDGREHTCPVFQRDSLATGQFFEGPAVVEQLDSTILIPPGYRGEIEPFGNLIIEAKENI
jgi:N-methylhydantoinase A